MVRWNVAAHGSSCTCTQDDVVAAQRAVNAVGDGAASKQFAELSKSNQLRRHPLTGLVSSYTERLMVFCQMSFIYTHARCGATFRWGTVEEWQELGEYLVCEASNLGHVQLLLA
jgi:hypothetical protein